MKKNLLIFGLIAATAVVFSCSKEPVQVEPAVTPAEETEEPTPVTPAVDGNLLTSFGVTFEGDTKVTVDLVNGETAIEAGDEVLVVVGSNSAVYVYDETDKKFSLKGGETAVTLNDTAQVFYPADEFVVSGEYVKFRMQNGIVATGDFGAIAPMAGVIEEGENPGTYTVELFNIASVLRVKVTADVNIESVTLDYGSMVYYADGSEFYVNALEKTMAYASEASDDTFETVTLTTPAKSADVLFIVPTVGLANGLTVTANLAENHNGGANTFTVTNANTDARARNTISTMNFKAKLFDGGLGTSESPYLIASAKDFKYIQKYTSEGYTPGNKDAAHFLDAYYKQTADIDFENATLTPIGNNSGRFIGNYDGYNKKLQNVNINVDSQFAAPFGYLDGDALIKDLTVTGTITTTGTTANSLAGGIAGILRGNAQITGCTNEATISSSATYTGGIAGRVYDSAASISGCINSGNVSGVGSVGGIVGQLNNGSVSSCDNGGTITATGDRVGGIAGWVNNASAIISECNNTGDVTANNPFAGGIAGDMNGTIDKCVNKGHIESSSSNVGGIAGTLRASSIIKRSYSSKEKNIQGTNRVGGIVGAVNGSGSWVVTCFSNSNVTGTSNTADYGVGGIVGILSNGTVANCSTGDVTVQCSATCSNKDDAKVYVGGIVGYLDENGTIQNVYSPLFAKDIKIGSIHGRSNSGKIGQIAGYTKGTLVGYYFGGCADTTTGWQYWGTNSSSTTSGQWAFTTANNVSMDWTQAINKNYSHFGVSLTSGYYLHDVMNVAISQEPLASGYTPATGEVLTWSAIDAPSDYHPIPDELLSLGADYYKN